MTRKEIKMITQHGPLCDVCDNYILPLDPEERVNMFSIQGHHHHDLCCHNKCKEILVNCESDWTKLPDGAIRRAFEKSSLEGS